MMSGGVPVSHLLLTRSMGASRIRYFVRIVAIAEQFCSLLRFHLFLFVDTCHGKHFEFLVI